jgi:hypothetical protein
LKKIIQNSISVDFWFFGKNKKKPELKNRLFFVLSKKSKNQWFLTKNWQKKKKNRRFLEFLISIEKNVATYKKNWLLFENSENWWVSGYGPGMITDGYHSLVQTPAPNTGFFDHGYQNQNPPPVWGGFGSAFPPRPQAN